MLYSTMIINVQGSKSLVLMMYVVLTTTTVLSLVLLTSDCSAFVLSPSITSSSATTTWIHQRSSLSTLVQLSTSTLDVTNTDIDKKENEVQDASSSKQFNWSKAWYPLVPVEILDREKPHRFELLGEPIVVWNDGPSIDGLFQSKKSRSMKNKKKRLMGTWRAFVDECPHRKVPLSEGRVEDDGSLLCSYHAFRFDGSGACISVPQIDSSTTEYTRILNNPKASCNSYPTKVVDGLLFVWPSSDKDAVLESELTPVSLPSRQQKQDNPNERNGDIWYGPWNYRLLPYGADYFLENVLDPAHVTVSHHNIIGNRYMVTPFEIASSQSLTKDGFAFNQKALDDSLPDATMTFMAPGLVTIDTQVSMDGAKQTLELYVSPSRPGFCNHVGRMVIQKDKDGKMPALLRQFTLPMPAWLSHILASVFLNQDALFIHNQERHLSSTGQYTTLVDAKDNENDTSNVYDTAVNAVPTDYGVLTFRNWLRFFAGRFIPYRNNQTVMPPPSNDVVFDVWNSHTKYCKYCQTALQRLKAVRFVSFLTAATMGVVRPFNVIGTTCITLLFGGIGLLLNKLIDMFYRYEFSHAHND